MAANPVTKKPKTAPKPSEHPKYIDMIAEAITTLKERNGSSRQAITKYIKEHYKVGDRYPYHIRVAIKANVKSERLQQSKGTGASGSFKVVKKIEPKAKPKKVVKPKAATKKPAAKKPKKPAASAKSPAKGKKKAGEKAKAKKSASTTKAKSKSSPKKKVIVKKPSKKPAGKGTPKKKPAAKKSKGKK